MSDNNRLKTVGDYIVRLSQFPPDWPVMVSTDAGGGITIEHRDVRGQPVVAVFGSNGGRFGENPLTEEEYQKQSAAFLRMWSDGRHRYTSIHGDHRLYVPRGMNDTCYGVHYDRRIIERMVAEGRLPAESVDIDRVRKGRGE